MEEPSSIANAVADGGKRGGAVGVFSAVQGGMRFMMTALRCVNLRSLLYLHNFKTQNVNTAKKTTVTVQPTTVKIIV